VVPQLNAYRVSAIDLVPKTLPRNITVENGRQEVEAGRGSVQYLPFAVEKARRVLLQATLPDGRPAPAGASVLDSKKRLVTVVTDGGEIFLTKDPTGDAFEVHTADDGVCTLEFQLPDKPNLEDYYETAKALCRPGPAESA
jgi:outer membrane usher protein FimD/PapC